jgi:hypothetical protein
MASAIEPNPPFIHALTPWRMQGIDFDQDGQESTLQDLLRVGGFFPLATIKERLPFSVKTIHRWAETKRDALSECIVLVRDKRGRCILTLIHLNRLDDFLIAEVEARAARVAETRSGRFSKFFEISNASVAG